MRRQENSLDSSGVRGVSIRCVDGIGGAANGGISSTTIVFTEAEDT